MCVVRTLSESRMLEIGMSGLMSGERKRASLRLYRASPRLYVRSYSAEHQRVQVPPQEVIGMPE